MAKDQKKANGDENEEFGLYILTIFWAVLLIICILSFVYRLKFSPSSADHIPKEPTIFSSPW